jgi:two-component sensor histidine kinase
VLRRGASEASLHALVRRLAEPYGKGRVTVAGADAALGAEAVPQLALILHEWLTNAAKHGALSAEGGRVAVATERDNGSLILRWTESGGPMIEGPPAERGFGSMLAEATAGSRFGGALEEEWHPAGLRLTLRLAADRVLAYSELAAAGMATAGPSTLSR